MRTLRTMADEGSRELHEPWAPTAPPPDAETPAEPPAEPRLAPPPPYDIEAELPTTELPAEPAIPPPPPFAPPPPPAAQAPKKKKKKWPGSAKAVAIILAVALVAAAGGLGYAWYKTNEDKKDLEKVTTAQSQELASQLDKANGDLATTKSALDAANKQATDLQSQLTTTQGQLKTAQDDAAASKATADALKALFPITPASVAGGLPGSYSSPSAGTVTGGCSVAPCPSVQLTLTIESASGALSVSDPALGRIPLQSGSGGWTANGTVQASLQLQCGGSPQPTSFVLSMAPAAVALDAKNAAQVTSLAGSLVLSAAAVTAPAPPAGTPPGPSCGPGVAAYDVVANRT
jgi:hypothetical protein